ncbi:MAG: FmdB family zinc ribbon protein, partial [Terriglobales bacterium]
MPMYEYQCQDCGVRFERLSWGQGSEVRCKCGSARAERIWYSRVA